VTDAILRGPKDLVLAPLARRAPHGLHPIAITLAGVFPGIGAAIAAADGCFGLALGLWLANRLLDGLDGTVARQRERESDLGAYLDIIMDFVVYGSLPIGIAAHVGTRTGWIAAAVLLATFYVNTVSWAYLAAIIERRRSAASRPRTLTAVTMPAGLIEGAETIVLFCAMLLFPGWAVTLFWIMAGGVAVTIMQRIVWAVRNL
jgi:phosphatidylglycerophosphate synthase